MAVARVEAAHALRELGDHDEASEEADRAVAVADAAPIPRLRAMARRVRALVHLDRGRLAEADAALEAAMACGEEPDGVDVAVLAADRAWVAAGRGDDEAVRRWLARARAAHARTAASRDRVAAVAEWISSGGRPSTSAG
ncbi:MAG: hypothetical protein AAF602_22025 [Myxococcota bacterium]